MFATLQVALLSKCTLYLMSTAVCYMSPDKPRYLSLYFVFFCTLLSTFLYFCVVTLLVLISEANKWLTFLLDEY